MKLKTIGFTQKSAEEFFALLRENGVERVVDIREHPGGQLSGFTKQGDLRYFLKALNNCDYVHLEELAPSAEVLKAYRADHNWEKYRGAFLKLMKERNIPETLDRKLFEEKTCCLLCSEKSADTCHRKLVAELLVANWPDVEVTHL